MAKRTRRWLGYVGEVFHALLADPVLLAPTLLVIGLAVVGAYLAWRFF